MLRLIGFFLLALAALAVLRELPVVGGIFRIPLVGFYLAAIVVSAVLAWWGSRAVDRGRFQRMRRELGQTDTPHNRGKLGSLLLAQGRHRQAIPHLEAAVEGDPDEVDWPYRLGVALLEAGKPGEAVAPLERAVELQEGHAYGAALLRLSEALLRSGRAAEALEVVRRFERGYGETPESAYRRGVAAREAGRKDEAQASFQRVPELASSAARYQRSEARWWAWKAFWARLAS